MYMHLNIFTSTYICSHIELIEIFIYLDEDV